MFNQPLVFIRHGQTDWNRQGRYQGSTDTRLSERGHQEALQNAQLVENLINSGTIDRNKMSFVSSPLQRASESAGVILKHLGHSSPPQTNNGFRELSAGRWEGLTSMEVKERYYEERKSRKSDRWNFMPTGGESMAGRASELRKDASQLPAHCIVITHSVVIKTLIYVLGGGDKCAITHTSVPHVGIWLWDGLEMRLISA